MYMYVFDSLFEAPIKKYSKYFIFGAMIHIPE